LTMVPPPMLRSFYVWIASLLLIGVELAWRPIGGELYHTTGSLAFAHAAIQAVGIVLIARAVSGLDPLELAGIRQAAGSTRREEPLQISGPYRLVRHPLYLGWMLALFGAAHMTGDRLAFAALTSAYLMLAIPWEERSLRQSFGGDYDRYVARVRWRVVPFIY
jgi:methanethiol S-methyltransferase